MRFSFQFRYLFFFTLALILFSVVTAIAATNTVPSTRLDHHSAPIGLNDLSPSNCAGIFVTNLVTGSGTITGTGGNDLILASSAADTIDGLGGDDCIVGGGGDDFITGNDGADICIGGPDNDTFATCEGEIQ